MTAPAADSRRSLPPLLSALFFLSLSLAPATRARLRYQLSLSRVVRCGFSRVGVRVLVLLYMGGVYMSSYRRSTCLSVPFEQRLPARIFACVFAASVLWLRLRLVLCTSTLHCGNSTEARLLSRLSLGDYVVRCNV